ncbi:MAG: D-2-hydroxyacid dehydrogenase [Chloroflexota bacterium]
MSAGSPVRILIASALELEYVQRIAGIDDRIEVLYAPEILPVPRYTADHHAPRRDLTEAQLDQWRAMLASADVSFDFDWWAPTDMPGNCPRLRWVQATSAGIGQFMERTGLDTTNITFTTAAGVHAIPLAEFALMGVLHFVKGMPSLERWQRAHQWERYTTRQLHGRRVAVVGLGAVGRRVIDVFAALGAEVWAVGRDGRTYDVPSAAGIVTTSRMDEILPDTYALVLSCPLTRETEGLISEQRLGLLPAGAVVVNIGRGQVVDEPALIRALKDQRLGGACLDVFATEPLPADSPLWDMSNVIVSPHSASTVDRENAALLDLFSENLRRWLSGLPLRNVYVPERGY